MLEEKDIDRIIKANSEFFASKKDLEDFRDEMRSSYSNLQKSVDKYVKQNEDSKQEFHMLESQVNRHEKWLEKIAAKNKLKLQY